MIAAAHQSTNSGAPRRLRANRQERAGAKYRQRQSSIASGNEVRNITVMAMAYTRPNNM